jgi:hypothetical protein
MSHPLRTLTGLDDVPTNPWTAQRRPLRACDHAVNGTTRAWLRRLPAGRRPLRLCELYPRVANRLAWCWADTATRQQTLADLLEDRRGGRRGFPACVVRELQRLRDYDGQPEAGSGPRWWRSLLGALQ